MKNRHPDLFDPPAAGYPHSPGFKSKTTSSDAARKMAPRAPTLRDQALVALREVWPAGMTPDEVAAVLGRSVLSIRPRMTELNKMGAIVPSTITRKNDSGMSAIVWVASRSFGSWT